MSDKPKFVISGNSIDEVMLGVMDVVRQTQGKHIEIKDAKKGGTSYGLYNWEKDFTEPTLEIAGMLPLAGGISVVFRKLVDKPAFNAESAKRKAATARNIETLKAKLARLESGE